VGKSDRGQGYYFREEMREGDGYITDEEDVVLGVKAADCVPILFEAEKDGEVVAVGAVHAGWRGTLAGIQKKCVSLLCLEYGVEPQNIRAAIGPCIHACCYEVGEELFFSVADTVGEKAKYFLTPVFGKRGKFFLDLVALNRYMLESAGVPSANIDAIELCTCCHPELFYSHRYSGGVRGTMLNVIYINKKNCAKI
jgi:YfiH family protein